MWNKRIGVALFVVLMPGVLLAPAWRLAGLGAGEDDILYYYPMRAFFHDTLHAGEWPWFNPWTGLGRPFAADPQTAAWYPLTWLFAALPPLWAYPLALWVHYSLALWGMYRLLRALALTRRAALFGGIAFAFCGFMFAHRAHFTIQNAAAWTPWVIWRLHRYTLSAKSVSPHGTRGTLRLVSATVVLALQCFAGHVQVAALTAVGALVFLLARAPRKQRFRAAGEAPHKSGAAARVAARWLIAWVCAAGVFAIQWLPTLDYVRLCTRAQRTYRDFVENSWHPTSVVGWLLPMIFGQRTPNFFDQPYWGLSHQVEQFAYAGLLPLVLALLALRRGWRGDPRRRPWVVLGLFGLLWALGKYGPICPILYWMPGSNLFRCPARAMLLVNLAVAALAAVTFNDLGRALSPQRARLRAMVSRWTSRPFTLAVVLTATPLVLILAAIPLIEPGYRAAALRAVRPWSTAVWVPLLLAWASLTALGSTARHWRSPRRLWLLVGLIALDFGVIGWTIDVPAGRSSPAELTTPRAPADWMDPLRDSPHRLWVATKRQGRKPGEYIDPVDKAAANTNVLRHIASLTDYGPLQPRSVVQRFDFAFWGETGSAQELLTDTDWMRLYDVGWILLCDESWPAPAGCDLATTTSAGWRLYRNPSAAGWALFEDPTQPGAVRFARHSAATFTTWADTWPTNAPGNPRTAQARAPETWPRLVASQLALPGWVARVSGRPVPVEIVAGGLMGVRVPPGEAVEITWSYFPPGLLPGALMSLASTLILGVSALRSARWKR